MRIAGLAFTPRLVPTVAALAMVVLTVSLGLWQSDRAQEKAHRQALLESRLTEVPLTLGGKMLTAEELLFRRVRAKGRFEPAGQIFIDNHIHGSRAGFLVVTPLAIGDSGVSVLVNRGWIARSSAYPAAPEVPVPAGEQMVEGIATVGPRRVLELSAETVSGNVWQNLSVERYAARSARPMLPVVILASPPAPGLTQVEEKPDTGIAKNREYSLTWYALAMTVAALWVGLNLRRIRA